MNTLINNETKSAVIYTHHACANLAYAIHRYDDEFSKSLNKLNITLRNMQGELFNIMSGDEDFLRAYLIHNIADKCVPYEKEDIVSLWVVLQNVHHDLRLHDGMTKEILFHTWRKLQFRKNVPAQERMKTLLNLISRRNHYEHHHKNLIKLAEDYNKTATDKIDIKVLKAYFKTSVDERKTDKDPCRYLCSLTNNYSDGEVIQNLSWKEWDKQKAHGKG